MDLKQIIKDVPNFPIDGIIYKDIQPLLADNEAFTYAVKQMIKACRTIPDYYIGIESRGFIFAAAMALNTGAGFRMVRKPGKLPGKTKSLDYDLEYGSDTLEIQPVEQLDFKSAIIVDDVYATGGTMEAAKKLVLSAGYVLRGEVTLIDLGLKENECHSVIYY